ncbi:MAG TPA: heavy metal translocating P-type ATPase [Actinomycetota bacterium]|nr:heavy metal translocating P-type ATPase [Actinomycetota bacterium]
MATGTDDREFVLDIEGMTCASCVQKVERALCEVPGVRAAAVNLATRTATVQGEVRDPGPLVLAVEGVGYGAHRHTGEGSAADEVADYRRRLVVGLALTIPILVLTFVVPASTANDLLTWILATAVLVYPGWPFLRGAARAARHGSTTMDTLIAVGALAAYGLSVASILRGSADRYFDTAAVIVTLVLVGKTLEARARIAASDASRVLLERGATTARVLEDGRERTIPIEELLPGMLAVVLPGEKIPADGVVREGVSWVDLSLLTGESVPVDVEPGDEVVGASINGTGRLVVFVSTVGANTRLAGIVRLLQAAQGSKAPVQRLADRISAVFVPVVLAIAAATFVGWAVLSDVGVGTSLLHATAVLVIACPCALGLATPAAVMAGTGRAAELGILFRGGEVFERARDVDTVLLDKTGTLTEGAMTLAAIVPAPGSSDDEVLGLAAAAESGSEHPIARAVVDAARTRGITLPTAAATEVRPGAGAVAFVDGVEVTVGRPVDLDPDLAADAGQLAARGLTPFAVGRGARTVGLLAVADRVRPEAPGAVARLRALGMEPEIVTGDVRATADTVAAAVGVERVLAAVFPEGKVNEVRRLEGDGRRVAFVGDGLNDAPALAAATVGVAMATGTDVALAAADVQVLGGSLGSVADALALARRTYRVIAENLVWAFAYNAVMIPLAVAGLLSPMFAAAAMALSSVSVVANALRLRRFGRGRNPAEPPGVEDHAAVRAAS